MTDDKDILQVTGSIRRMCAGLGTIQKALEGQYKFRQVHGERDCQVFRLWSPRGFRLRCENRNNCREFLLFGPYE